MSQLQTFSPTPQTASIYMFLMLGLGLALNIRFADVKNAFCESDPLHRPDGPLYAEPCPGLALEAQQLIEPVAPVYGLLDAPRAWRETVVKRLKHLGLRWSSSMFARKLLVWGCVGQMRCSWNSFSHDAPRS